MAKYRKKPIMIEAHRLGDDYWDDSIWQGVMDHKIILYMSNYSITGKGYAEISTLEGTMRAEIGDYIIRGVKGEFYPCKPDIFEQTYESVKLTVLDKKEDGNGKH